MTTNGVFIWQDYQRGTKVIPPNFEFITQSNHVTDHDCNDDQQFS